MTYLKSVISAVLLFSTSAWACPDFSGEWIGTCQSDDEELEQEVSFKISQRGCERFVFNGETIKVGLLETQTLDNMGRNTSLPSGRTIKTSVSHWAQDMLLIDSMEMRVSPKTDEGVDLTKTMNQKKLFLDKDGRLTYRSISSMAVGENIDVNEVICRCQKQ
ncbi:MAG: hypothetical protein AAB309_07140 [Deltaproteobacteria bacterium]